jgi:hypothetical protein
VLIRKWMELAYFVPCLTSEFVDNQSKYGFAPKSTQGDVSCCLGCAGLPSCSQRPSHSVLRLFPLTQRRKVAGAAAVGAAVAGAAAVGVAVVGAAAAAAVKSGFRRLRRRAVAAAVGAAPDGTAAVGTAAAGVAVAAAGVAVAATGVAVVATGVAVVGMAVVGVVGNLWIIKAGCRRISFFDRLQRAVRSSRTRFCSSRLVRFGSWVYRNVTASKIDKTNPSWDRKWGNDNF